jgi:hypothetical protein
MVNIAADFFCTVTLIDVSLVTATFSLVTLTFSGVGIVLENVCNLEI